MFNFNGWANILEASCYIRTSWR